MLPFLRSLLRESARSNFETIDQTLPNATGQPSIGIILCTDRKKPVVEYALSTTQSMGVATYETPEGTSCEPFRRSRVTKPF